MELFDKKYVHFMWDDELEGKEGFFSDSIDILKIYVEDNDDNLIGNVSDSNRGNLPFHKNCGGVFRFFYYDPNYEVKRAYAEGKQIQFRYSGDAEWDDCKGEPLCDDDCEYRIKPEEQKTRRMTYRELAEWLAKGNGEHTTTLAEETVTSIKYYKTCADKEVLNACKIRRWGSDEWIEPTVDIYEADCKKEE